MEGIYKIKLILSDLTSEETILQIAETLDNLNGIVDDVFTRLNCRINDNVCKTAKLKERIEISKANVEKLTGMQKAIKVFSSAKYPVTITANHYKSILTLDGYKHKPEKITLSRKSNGLAYDKGIQEKLHFYHVKVGQSKNNKYKKDYELQKYLEGASTVGEILIFNTDESPYFGGSSKISSYIPEVHTKIVTKSLLEAAPSSIINRDILKRETDEYMYIPGMGMVPELEMPLDLPHLPGIAGDIQYSVTHEGTIAPSAVTSPMSPVISVLSVPESILPDLEDLPDLKEVPASKSTGPVDMPDTPATEVLENYLPQTSLSPPPPPPPPPLPPLLPVAKEEVSKALTREVKTAQVAPPGDAHASLMAAIRQAGGASRAKLKSAVSSMPSKNAVKSAGGGDLMADLHAKLSMRRKGISGAERTGGSVLHTLANVIPEPDQSSTQHSSSGEDWD